MKAFKLIATGTVLMMLLTFTTTSLFAQEPNRPQHPQGITQGQIPPALDLTLPPVPPVPPAPPAPPAGDFQDLQTPQQLDLPGLTNEQKDKIHDADLDHLKIMTPLHNQIREKKARLQTVLTTSPFDLKTADQVAEDIGKIETGVLKELIRHDQILRNLLNPQQQILFDARPKPFLRRQR